MIRTVMTLVQLLVAHVVGVDLVAVEGQEEAEVQQRVRAQQAEEEERVEEEEEEEEEEEDRVNSSFMDLLIVVEGIAMLAMREGLNVLQDKVQSLEMTLLLK